MLDLNSTARSVHGACELNQDTVTRSLRDARRFWVPEICGDAH
jgi:hypothetical protein